MEFSDIDRFLHDFADVVNTDSASGNTAGILTVARFFEERLLRLGMNCEILMPGNGQVPCLKATIGAPPYDVMCLGHMDTVFPKGEAAKRPFALHDDRAWGPGVCDMKGGLLVALHALETLKKTGDLDTMSICVLFNGDEETGSAQSRPLILETAGQCRHVLVFEPCRPEYRLVSQRKGGGWFRIEVTGREAHAGADPHKGVNAVVELARLVPLIQNLNDENTGTSTQVTVFHGGDKVNIIPSLATASVDVRILDPGEKPRVESFFAGLPRKRLCQDAQIRITGDIDRPPMAATKESLALEGLITRQAKELGIDMKAITTGGCSDGNFTASAGVPTIDGLGLVGANSHRPDEYVELASIPVMVSLISRVCRTLTRQNR
ncbi:MAG: M20 family metallopeptidase [Desulfotignum sp.]|nr:M20 family metallopeptidase [Desulfotignum sp.]